MKVLITGGAGYIGSHTIIDILEHTDYEVVSVDNFSNSEPESYDRIKEITGKSFRHYDIDLTDRERLEAELFEVEKTFDGIIHFAAFKAVGDSVEDPLAYYHNNVTGLIHLLECATKYRVSGFIFSSSCTVYGDGAALPVTEEAPFGRPESPYGKTKLTGEGILEDLTAAGDSMKSIALRYFNPVGAHESGRTGELPKGKPSNLVPAVTQFASGWLDSLFVHGTDYETRDGTAIRDYIHVSDVAHAHRLAFDRLISGDQTKNYDVFNLGMGQGVTVLEVIQAFESSTGKKLNYTLGPKRSGDVEAIYADNKKSREVLGWSPERSIEDAMRSAWKWQQHLNTLTDYDKARPE